MTQRNVPSEAIAQTCSQCGWSFDTDALQKNTCKKCLSAILVTSVAYLEKFDRPAIQKYIAQFSEAIRTDPENRDALIAIGICYLKLGLFDLSDRFFRLLVDAHPSDASGYYYGGICSLKGRRPRTAPLLTIRHAESLIQTALELDPTNGRYEVLLATIRYDYYVMNGLRVPKPSPTELIASAAVKHWDQLEIAQVLRLMNVGDGPVRQLFPT